MNTTGTQAGAAVGGLIGCAAWLGVAYVTGYELGILAILVGTACGIGAAVGAKGMAGTKGGLIAAAVTVMSILAARYFIVQISINQIVNQAMAENGQDIPGPDDGEHWTAFMADQIIRQRENAGEFVDWPDYDEEEMDSLAAQYPDDVWADASVQWSSMNGSERQEFCTAGRQMIMNDNVEGIETFRGVMGVIGFLVSNLHPMALIIMGIAVVTAFKVARNSRPKMPENEFATETSSMMPQTAAPGVSGPPGMPAGTMSIPTGPTSLPTRPAAIPKTPSAAPATPPIGESTYLPPWLRGK